MIEGLSALAEPADVELCADSEYVLKGIDEWLDGWKRRGWRTAAKKPVKTKNKGEKPCFQLRQITAEELSAQAPEFDPSLTPQPCLLRWARWRC